MAESNRLSRQQIRENYQFTLRHLQNNIFRLGLRAEDGQIVYLLNEGPIPAKFGVTSEVVYNRSPVELFGEELSAGILPYFERAFNGEVCSYELTVEDVIFETVLSPIEKNGRVVEVAGSSFDITERRRYQSELEEMNNRLSELNRKLQSAVVTDPLTGLYNRRKFDQMVEYELARTDRYQKPFSVVIVDADKFKMINDIYGHLTGDDVLKGVANLLQDNVRECDTLARWGGEEFSILLPETEPPGAVQFAGKLLDAVRRQRFAESLRLTLSAGVAVWQPGDGLESVLRRADRALYRAKENGRDCVVLSAE